MVANTYSMYIDGRCAPNTDLVTGSLDANGEIVHWLYSANVATSGGTADLSGTPLTQTPTSKTFTWTNIPPALGGVGFADQLHSTKGQVIQFEGSGSGTSVSQTLKVTPFTNALEVVFTGASSNYSFHAAADWAAFSSTAYSLDLGARLLKDATSGASFDITNKRATWTEEATGVMPDFASADAQIYRSAGGIYIYWDVVAAYSEGQVQYPTLPVETVDYNPASGDVVEVTAMLGKAPGGWDAVREVFFALDNPSALAPSGSVTIQQIDSSDQLLAPMMRLVHTVAPRKRHALVSGPRTRTSSPR
jgi:hypothetical protein